MRKQKNTPDDLDTERLADIFTRLEERPGSEQSGRIEKLLDLLSRLRPEGPDRVQVVTGLRYALRRYKWVSSVLPARVGYRVISTIANRENLSAEDVWEHNAVRDLLDLVPRLGDRPRIRRCEEPTCNKWFYAAKRDDHRFHNPSCKQRAHEGDPAKREKKKERMRKLYALEKARAERAKKGVGYGRPVVRRAKKK